MVFFKNKAGSLYSVNTPSEYLSERAIARRKRHNIRFTENDLPVNRNYVETIAQLGISTYFTTKWMNGVLVQMDPTLVDDVLALPVVERVEYVAPGSLLSPQPDVSTKFQKKEVSLSQPRINQQQYEMLQLDKMHAAGFKGEGILIGIFDSGFQNYNTLPAFSKLIREGRLQYTIDFTDNRKDIENEESHGIGVFSILAADNEMIGAAPNANYILAVTEAPGEYRIEEYNWLFAAEMADSAGVDIINTSLGYNLFSDKAMDYTAADMNGQTAVVTRAANIASSKGILVVAAAGNNGNTPWNIISAPADSKSVLSVGAVNPLGLLAAFSGKGPTADKRIKPDVVALGAGTQLTTAQGEISFQNGTSFAAPLITGMAAGLMQAFPEKSNDEIMQYIRMSGDRSDSPDNFYGYGIPGFVRASQLTGIVPISMKEETVIVYPNPTSLQSFTVSFSEIFLGKRVFIHLYNSKGEFLSTYTFTPRLFDSKLCIHLNNAKTGTLLLRLESEVGTVTKKVMLFGN